MERLTLNGDDCSCGIGIGTMTDAQQEHAILVRSAFVKRVWQTSLKANIFM